MVYKVFDEFGDYIDKTTGERKNMLKANWADTPLGMNVGWDEFTSDSDAMAFFGLEYSPINSGSNTP